MQLKDILSESRNRALDEISDKVDSGYISKDSHETLTQRVADNVGQHFYLSFGREEPDGSTSEIEFFFTEVLLLTDKRFIIQGDVNTSRSVPTGKKRPTTIQIDYHFDEQTFHEALLCRNNTVRDRRLLSLDIAGIRGQNNIATAKQLVYTLTLCLYSGKSSGIFHH